MNFDFLNKGWVGSAIGLAGLVAAILIYIRTRSVKRLAYQFRNSHLIGGNDAQLPSAVKVEFNGVDVPRVAKTTVVMWNEGNTTLRGIDIVDHDRLRIEFPTDCKVLEAKVSKITREVILFKLEESELSRNSISCNFDFLDPKDGVRIEILHTSAEEVVDIKGTIRGLPEGCTNLGRIPRDSTFTYKDLLLGKNRAKPFFYLLQVKSVRNLIFGATLLVGLIIGVLGIFAGHFYKHIPEIYDLPSKLMFVPGEPNFIMIIAGLLYMALPLTIFWIERKRFPSSLSSDGTES